MLNKFTVLACYCIYFSKSASEYSHMFANVSRAHRTDESVDEIAKAAVVAIKMMQPDWQKNKERLIKEISVNKKLIKELKIELKQAEYEYSQAEKRGGQLRMELDKGRVKKLREQINECKVKINRARL